MGAVYLRTKARSKATTSVNNVTMNDPNWIINDNKSATVMAPPPPHNGQGAAPKVVPVSSLAQASTSQHNSAPLAP